MQRNKSKCRRSKRRRRFADKRYLEVPRGTLLPVPADPTIPGFEVLGKLGSGGMGDVLLARRSSARTFQKLVAIKTIKSSRLECASLLASFLDEARLVARLDHPTIAQIYDYSEIDGMPYLVLEYVAGLTVLDLMF